MARILLKSSIETWMSSKVAFESMVGVPAMTRYQVWAPQARMPISETIVGFSKVPRLL